MRFFITVLNEYKRYFPNHLVTIGVDKSMMDEKVIVSCAGLLGDPNGIAGLFFPLHQGLKIKVSSCRNNAHVQCVEVIANDLAPDDEQTKSTIIMFSNSYTGFSLFTQALKLIEKR